jgi:hypothetical protein
MPDVFSAGISCVSPYLLPWYLSPQKTIGNGYCSGGLVSLCMDGAQHMSLNRYEGRMDPASSRQ